MNIQAQAYVEKYLRTYRDVFTVRDMLKVFSSVGIRTSLKDVRDFLEHNSLVFSLENDTYITQAGAFTGVLFSIKPTGAEYDQNIIVAGDRCMPFVDSEIGCHSLAFFYEDKKLPQKIGKFNSDDAIDMFMLYGEEYAPQYIASDPANESLNLLLNSFELPNEVSLTGVDISELIKKGDLQKGDRILCYVRDWNLGYVDMVVVHDGHNLFDCGAEGDAKLDWYEKLESFCLEEFENEGPCAAIEEQLTYIFFMHRKELCVPICGSVEEYIKRYAKKVGMQEFGVETRLWYKGQSVPAVGKWNMHLQNSADSSVSYSYDGEGCYYTVSPDILDHYVLDMLYHHKTDVKELMHQIYPDDYVFHLGEKGLVMMNLTDRNEKFRLIYNWFADQTAGPIRESALELYKKVNELMFEVEKCYGGLSDFPQQELVILTQLYNHIIRILQSFMTDADIGDESEAILASLDGMRCNFEGIQDVILGAIDECRCNRFKVVR
ncbi:MAG: hypothetical protein K6G00_10105 [Treponema sp.]|nr:hypothetical protein [Treponema sp.]